MPPTLAALLPVFLAILAGALLKRTGLVKAELWPGVDHVCYYVLFPALVLETLARADLSTVPALRMAGVLLAAIATLFALLIALRHELMARLAIGGPAFTTLVQCAIRWHSFIALSIAPALYGREGLTLAAIGLAAMIPVVNVMSVGVLTVYGQGARPGLAAAFAQLARNPFVLSSLGGLLLNVLAVPVPASLLDTLQIIGRGALGLALLTVGAGLSLAALRGTGATVALAIVLKLCLMPALMASWSLILGLDGLARTVAILVGAVPTASGAYILARQMGGDAPLAANIITAQVLASALTLPVVIWLAAP